MTSPVRLINIPTWTEASRACGSGNATALDIFVYEHEPHGEPQSVHWRIMLSDALREVRDRP